MILEGITLAGFKCFRERVTFSFQRDPGLYFLTGHNAMVPELGANAVGKSSLLDAVSWCLYGKTLRKLKAKDVEAWGAGGHVSVILQLDGQYLRRGRKPNYLGWVDSDGLELQPLTQAEVDEYVGISFEMFTNAIVFGQFNKPFLDLMPAEKEKLFSEALELDSWLAYSDAANEKSRGIEALIQDLDRAQARLEGEVASAEEEDYAAHAKDWELDRKSKIADAVNSLTDVAKAQERLTRTIKKDRATIKTARNALDDINLELRDLQRDIEEMDQVLQSNYTACNQADTLIRQTEQHIEEFAALEGTCSLCGSEISEEDEDEHLDRLDAELLAYQKQRKALSKTQADIRTEVDKLHGMASKVRAEKDIARETLISAEVRIDNNSTARSRLDREEKALRKMVSELKKESNPFAALERKREESLNLLTQELEDLDNKLNMRTGRLDAFRYWVRGFRNMRLYLMDERLNELEMESNNILGELGLVDWRIQFTTERKVGRGGKQAYKPGFFVRIANGKEVESVPWEAWSGGESQRLRLAGSIGFASMILNYAGVESDIEFWDEPSSYLSEEGIEDLLDALYYRARNKGKQIWVIDHRALNYGGFTETVVVTNDERGSYFET